MISSEEKSYIKWAMKRLGHIPNTEEKWKWRQALVLANIYTDREICDFFHDPWTKTIRLISKDKSKLKITDTSHRLLIWRLGRYLSDACSMKNYLKYYHRCSAATGDTAAARPA